MPSYIHPFTLFRILLLPALVAFLYLYFYPAINDCAFPPARKTRTTCSESGCKDTTISAGKPPFRLLALADPQLEGDTSLPAGWSDGAFAGLEKIWDDVRERRLEDFKRDLPVLLQGYRKKLDLWGNDLYLAHIYRQTRWWVEPSHTVVLGDLLGSQWIADEEFDRRVGRFWNTVFETAQRVPGDVMVEEHESEVLGREKEWKRRLMAVAGNHDVGYAGDLNEARIERFERAFGRVNWELTFKLPNETLQEGQDYPSQKNPDFYAGPGPQPKLRLVILNSMNLDEPARSPDARTQSHEFLANIVCNANRFHNENAATVLLTHIPLHKEEGICVDGPFFSYFSPEHGSGIREQNHLSEGVSSQILDCLRNSKPAVILNGHDHEGCDTHHYLSQSEEATSPKAVRHSQFSTLPIGVKSSAIREITVRSMMGSYGGYAGFLSGWYDENQGKWEFEYATCGFGVQHIWWVCNIVLLVEIGLAVLSGLDALAAQMSATTTRQKIKEA